MISSIPGCQQWAPVFALYRRVYNFWWCALQVVAANREVEEKNAKRAEESERSLEALRQKAADAYSRQVTAAECHDDLHACLNVVRKAAAVDAGHGCRCLSHCLPLFCSFQDYSCLIVHTLPRWHRPEPMPFHQLTNLHLLSLGLNRGVYRQVLRNQCRLSNASAKAIDCRASKNCSSDDLMGEGASTPTLHAHALP